MKNHVRQGNPERERQWQEAVQRWRQSGQTVRDYCRAHGLKESAFYFWRQELTRRGNQRSHCRQRASKTPKRGGAATPAHPRSPAVPGPLAADGAHFLPVRIVSPAAEENRNGLEIALGDDRVIRVPRGFDRQTLAEVLAVLEVRPC
jgi:hypothetical protein